MPICKNPLCENRFTPTSKNHFYCCVRCREKRYAISEKGKATRKRYQVSEKGKTYNIKKQQVYRAKYPERGKAWDMANWALRKITNHCSVFGCNKLGEKHHPDYNKPLKVVFLCKEHHIKLHKESQA